MSSDAIPAWPFHVIRTHPRLWRLRKATIVPPVGILSKLFFDYLSKSVTHNRDTLWEAVENRPAGQGLITVCNHYSCLDEPILHGMLKWRHLVRADTMRWSAAAHDICFTQPLHRWFFASGKCVPVVRGEGVHQRAVTFLRERLQRGEWVHLFPEGRVNVQHERLRLKWGVGRLVAEPARCPLVLPFYHLGMDDVLPNRTPYIPRLGQKVTVLVGEPMELDGIMAVLRRRRASSREMRRIITERIQGELEMLRRRVETLHVARGGRR